MTATRDGVDVEPSDEICREEWVLRNALAWTTTCFIRKFWTKEARAGC